MLGLLSLRKVPRRPRKPFLTISMAASTKPELKIIDIFICKPCKKLANASEGCDFTETVRSRRYVLRESHGIEERIPAWSPDV